MAAVSILIPACKAEYLGRAILSAQRQTFEDIEILVGDDTPDAALEPVVGAFADDPRVQYIHHGFQNGTRNARALWARASGQYVKWLSDDDLLMPTSVEALVAALRANPQSQLAFHGRVIIDGSDAVVATPPALLPAGQAALIDRATLVENMVADFNNFIGEPSNTMLVREGIDIDTLFDYREFQLDFLGDVAMFLNVAQRAPLLAVGGYLSALRRHADEASATLSANFSAGLYEWEMIARGEASTGNLTDEALQRACRSLRRNYGHCSTALPEIARLLANLDEFDRLAPHQLYTSPRFQADLAHARAAVAARVSMCKKGAAGQQQKVCAVCEQPVPAWLPHPDAANVNHAFMEHVGSVGSTLQHHLCPNCGCNDRDRHLWLYLAFSRILENAPAMRILHIAPEARLEPRILALNPREYVAADLAPRAAHHRKIDVEQLEFRDGYFDLIICNHVLERVARPDVALAEFSRCLAPGGHLVAQTPYSPLLRSAFELNRAPNEAFAATYFGHGDHVRLFGSDIADRFRAAGLCGDLYPHTTVLGDIDPDTWGCNGREPFFLFAKGPAPIFEAAVA